MTYCDATKEVCTVEMTDLIFEKWEQSKSSVARQLSSSFH